MCLPRAWPVRLSEQPRSDPLRQVRAVELDRGIELRCPRRSDPAIRQFARLIFREHRTQDSNALAARECIRADTIEQCLKASKPGVAREAKHGIISDSHEP